MEKYLPIIKSSNLFKDMEENEIISILSCLQAKKENFAKDTFILRVGNQTNLIGLVLSGNVLVIQEDIWGNRNILSKIGPGQTFATAYACAKGAILDVSVFAETSVNILFLNINQVLNMCSSSCKHHNLIIQNLLEELAYKNIGFAEKITHIGQRSTRSKIMSYLSFEAQRFGKYEFDIPFSRQQLADYLAVERSGLSLELSKMQREGLIEFYKNHFIIKIK